MEIRLHGNAEENSPLRVFELKRPGIPFPKPELNLASSALAGTVAERLAEDALESCRATNIVVIGPERQAGAIKGGQIFGSVDTVIGGTRWAHFQDVLGASARRRVQSL
jgi:hypothetical protein